MDLHSTPRPRPIDLLLLLLRGLPYMTSAVSGGRGSPKSRQKKHNQLICDSDKGDGVKKNPKILRTSYMEAPYPLSSSSSEAILQCKSLYI